MRCTPQLFRISALLCISLYGHLPGSAAPAANELPEPRPQDAVCFIAKEKPTLYRLEGDQPVPVGPTRFRMPQAILADPKRGAFIVLDKPTRLDQEVVVWSVRPDGSADELYRGKYTMHGGALNNPRGLGLDPQGRVLICDIVTGLFRIEANGRITTLIDSPKAPLRKINAVAPGPQPQIIRFASSYQHQVVGPDRNAPANVPVMIGTWQSQGGLYDLDLSTHPAQLTRCLENKSAGGAEYDTLWRAATQLLLDSGGRYVLVDEGTFRQQKYDMSARRTYYEGTEINGGVMILHADGRFEDLTFKTSGRVSSPMRHPRGVAQWSTDTYLVADPEMWLEGMDGSGGLLLLKLDGSRDGRWRFGWKLKPFGVAILRVR